MFDIFFGRGDLRATRKSTCYVFNHYFALGMNPRGKYKWLYYLYSACFTFSAQIFLPTTFCLSYYYYGKNMTISQLLTSIQVAINVVGLPPKVIAMYISLPLLRKGCDIMDVLDQSCTREDEFAQIRRCIILCNRATVFYVTFYTTYAFTTMVTSMVMGMPPYNLVIPLMDWRESDCQFVMQSITEFLLMCTICLHQSSADVYAFIYIYVMRTHMQILVKRVARFGKEENADQITEDQYYAQLVKCVKDHQTFLR